MQSSYMPHAIQAVGLACVPVPDMPAGSLLARRPVAAAVVTLRARDSAEQQVDISCLSDARDTEFPLPMLLDQALSNDAPTIITTHDRMILQLEAVSRRFFVEPRLAALAAGEGALDPVSTFGAGDEERMLCRRLSIPECQISDRDVELGWRRDMPAPTEGLALSIAAARLMLWAHGAAFRTATPDPLFETLLPLRQALFAMEERYPMVKALTSCRPMNRVVSFAGYYRDYRVARDAGDRSAEWVTFEDNLLHV